MEKIRIADADISFLAERGVIHRWAKDLLSHPEKIAEIRQLLNDHNVPKQCKRAMRDYLCDRSPARSRSGFEYWAAKSRMMAKVGVMIRKVSRGGKVEIALPRSDFAITYADHKMHVRYSLKGQAQTYEMVIPTRGKRHWQQEPLYERSVLEKVFSSLIKYQMLPANVPYPMLLSQSGNVVLNHRKMAMLNKGLVEGMPLTMVSLVYGGPSEG